MVAEAAPGTFDPVESMALLRSVPVGRIIFTDGGLPAVQPVNFCVFEESIVIRTVPGAKLAAVGAGIVVAFEADQTDAGEGLDWSVTVVGHARVVDDPGETARLLTLPLESWAPGERTDLIRIDVERIAGKRFDRRQVLFPTR